MESTSGEEASIEIIAKYLRYYINLVDKAAWV
jgi:hypothetical protein